MLPFLVADPVHVSNIAKRCGRTNDGVHKWIDRHGSDKKQPFPSPRWGTGNVKTYEGSEVLAWLRATDRHDEADAWVAWVDEHGTGYQG